VALQIYKSGQGRYVRVGTAIGAAAVDLIIGYSAWLTLHRQISDDWAGKVFLEYTLPAVLFTAIAVTVAWFLNKPNVVDFFIATESEMKKVSWSSRAELVGSTAVVIVTVLMLALLIYIVDIVFVYMMKNGLGLW
jgi:preprotein translocase subunit SecE